MVIALAQMHLFGRPVSSPVAPKGCNSIAIILIERELEAFVVIAVARRQLFGCIQAWLRTR